MITAAIAFAATAFGRSFRFYSVATIIVMLAFGAWSGMDAPRVEAGLATPWLGVKERIFWYAYQLWFVVLAVTLLRQRLRQEESR
jgi:NADH:ubiquinone oxidoreductase subunit H